MKKLWLSIALLAMTQVGFAKDTDAELMASGQWRDPSTGLIWMRCAIGQTWTGDTCSGEPLKMNWGDATEYFSLFNQDGFAGKRNWRLPNIKELSSIRRCSTGWAHKVKTVGNLTKDMGVDMNDLGLPQSCADGSDKPALDSNIFPNAITRDNSYYWSASPYAFNSGFAWNVPFYDGNSGNYYKNNYYYVRAVRSGQ